MPLASFCLASALAAPDWGPQLDEALRSLGLDQSTARIDRPLLRLYEKGEFAPLIYSTLQEDPWRTPFYTQAKREDFLRAAGKPSDLMASGGAWLGWGVRRTLLGNPNASAEAAAATPEGQAKVLGTRADGVPEPVRRAAALIILTAEAAQPELDRTLARLGGLASAGAILEGSREGAEFPAILDLYRKFEPSRLMATSHDLALAVQTAAVWAEAVPPDQRYSARFPTKWGEVILRGGQNDRDDLSGAFLLIDTGGDDSTRGAASALGRFSIHIDTHGRDQYLSDWELGSQKVEAFAGRKEGKGLGPASARLGFSMLVDSRGADLYRSRFMSLGAGDLGFSALLDKEGDDQYDAYSSAQGYGLFGAGVLEDLAGNDRYEGFTLVQGASLTQGLGLLVDRAGNDAYIANDTVIDFPSAQSAQHNASLSQGSSFGRRADYSDGQSLAGGVAILLDGAGSDTYSCGVFGQGVGYWMAVGALWDVGGSDQYQGQWYVQGASAHFAVGILEDDQGDDAYTALMNMAQGAGHDFSLGFLRDGGGSDRYQAPNLSLGAGNANSVGWLLEQGGDDTYAASGFTLGRASTHSPGLRSRALNLGVFLDLGGKDTYPPASDWATDGALSPLVATPAPFPRERALGVFLDREAG